MPRSTTAPAPAPPAGAADPVADVRDRAGAPDGGDVGAMAAQLRVSATRLARLLRRQGDTGLSPSQISALTAIDAHGPLTLGALAEHERVAPPSITNAVAKLEQAGLVARQACASDRRVAHVSTTPAGEALLAEVRQRKDVWLAARLGELDPRERARLAAALDVIDRLTGQGQG